ncbi:somatostatin receptor type 4-like [Antedon mediterranea]|uniref:somatostatin receptor type 4-like n=1 Tax=Antedon mediterranea TaxID=105859 RepID=UPI003AF8E9BE
MEYTYNENMTTAVDPTTTADDDEWFRFEVPFFTTICTFGLVGNLLVLFVYARKEYRRSNASLYILNLTFGDMLSMIVVAFHITEFYPSTWPFLWRHDWQCVVHRYCRYLCFHVTVFILLAIAVDRYFAVCHVVRYKLHFTRKRTRRTLSFVWALAIVTSAPVLMMFQTKYEDNLDNADVKFNGQIPFACKVVYPDYIPWFGDFKALYFNVCLFFVPVFIIAFFNARIVLFMRRYAQDSAWIDSHCSVKHYQSHNSVKLHWRMAKLLVMVSVVYFLCYLLFAIYQIVSYYGTLNANLKNIAIVLPYVNSCANPVMYSLFNENFRKAFWKQIKEKKIWKKAASKTPSTINTIMQSIL